MRETDVNKNNAKGDITTWQGKFIRTLSGICEFERNEKWYDRVPESVLENEDINRSVCEQIMEMRRGDCIW